MIQIECLNRRQLAAFVASDVYRRLPDLPVSAHRAASHIHNPRLSEEDTLLIVAWIAGELVGYLGVLPDYYFPNGQKAEKCGWLSCLWVSEKHRGKSIAKHLVKTGAESIGGRILLTEFTPQAKQLYDRLGLFQPFVTLNGIRVYYRWDLQRLLPPKKRFFEKMIPMLQVVDFIGNLPLMPFYTLHAAKKKPENWVYVAEIDAETAAFIAENHQHELFRRNADELNWALHFPWIIPVSTDPNWSRYYFSSVDPGFQTTCLKIYDTEQKLQAFIILTRRNNALKMPVCYLRPNSQSVVAEVIQWHIRKWQINMFSTFHPEMQQYFRTKWNFALYKKRLRRQYLATPSFLDLLTVPNATLQDGDGDCFFT